MPPSFFLMQKMGVLYGDEAGSMMPVWSHLRGWAWTIAGGAGGFGNCLQKAGVGSSRRMEC